MDEYKIRFSIKSKEDLIKIIGYIKYELKEPIIAKKYAKLFWEEISKLKLLPERCAVIDIDNIKYVGVRKLIIKNFIVFYRVNNERKLVTIERILNGAINWQDKI